MALYRVEAIRERWLNGAFGRFKARDGYVVHRSFQEAESKQHAIDQVLGYHMTPGTKWDFMRAELA